MEVGQVFLISNGKQQIRYMCTSTGPLHYELRRCCLPKTKADANRFAPTISIKFELQSAPIKPQ